MKLLAYILALCFLVFTVVQADDFSILFYQKPNFKIDEGVISGSVSPGGGGGAKSGNMSVGSFKTQSFLQVTLYEGKYYQGQSHVYVGSQKKISPPLHVGSVKWKHL